MKVDSKTNKKTPENRLDEIVLSFDEIQKLQEKCSGTLDKQIERNIMLRDINVSLAQIVDILAVMLNRMLAQDKSENKLHIVEDPVQ